MSIGNRINELRVSHNYSQEYVAEQLDVSRQAVSKWEKDQTSPDTNNLIALAQLFGVSVEYLATGKEGHVPPPGAGSEPLPEERPDQTGANRMLGLIVWAIALIVFFGLRVFHAPGWVIAVMTLPLVCAGCFIFGFAGRFQ